MDTDDILTDPVLRLGYDFYGFEGVEIIKRIRMQREQQNRKNAANVELEGESDDDDDGAEASLYDRLEKLIARDPILAREELTQFMNQHEYHQKLLEDQQVQLSCTLEFPPVIDLRKLYFAGKDYIARADRNRAAMIRGKTPQEIEYINLRVEQEKRIVDYQINRIKDSQKAEVGFTLAGMESSMSRHMTGDVSIRPKWSMTMGGSANLMFADVEKIDKITGQKENAHRDPASLFANILFQPVPDSQVYATANMSNDQSAQYVVGSARTFANKSAFRYHVTILPTTSLKSPLIFNLRSDRHIKDLGMTSFGLSIGGNFDILQWNAGIQKSFGTLHTHRGTAKMNIGLLQGNSLKLGYKYRRQKDTWLQEYMTVPKRVEVSASVSQFPKAEGMITQEFTSLASHPTLGFGFEHDINLGLWTWIWEWTYQGSTFRVPVPVLSLGTIVDPASYYAKRVYYAIYCLFVQTLIADMLGDEEPKTIDIALDETPSLSSDLSTTKEEAHANQQLFLMRSTAEKKTNSEMKRNGLVIRRAVYWVQRRHPSRTGSRFISLDATTQLQFWVTESKLVVPALPKSSWMGFYKLEEPHANKTMKIWRWQFWKRWGNKRSVTPNEEKQEPRLTIRYVYQEFVYEITIADTEEITLPNSKAVLIGPSSVILD
jgi:hypothetical protein